MKRSCRVLMTLRATPVALDELRTVQALVESDAVYQRETVQGLARKLGFYETSGGIEREARYYEAIAALAPGRKAGFELRRSKEKIELKVEIGRRPALSRGD